MKEPKSVAEQLIEKGFKPGTKEFTLEYKRLWSREPHRKATAKERQRQRRMRENQRLAAYRDGSLLAKLTKGELLVAAGVLDGRSNKEIQEKLFVTCNGIKFHVTNILAKAGCKTRFEFISGYHSGTLRRHVLDQLRGVEEQLQPPVKVEPQVDLPLPRGVA